MDSVAIRVFSFSILPVIIAAGHLSLDRSSRRHERRLELFLLYLFGVGVAGSAIGGFFGHSFISDPVAESIGWPTGNPSSLRLASPTWPSGSLALSPWAGAMASARPPSSRPQSWASGRPSSMSWTSSRPATRSRQHHPERQQPAPASLADRVPGCQPTSGALA